MYLRRPPILRMSCSWCRAMMTEPAPRKRRALKNAWVIRWKMAAEYAEAPSATVMYPSWDSVEYATTRLMSYWTTAMRAVKKAVIPPITSTKESAVSESSKSGDIRATMKMPAVTMVAAWIRAEIGVGPSIESGSHTCRGNCADLPIAPMKSPIQIAERSSHGAPGTASIVTAAIDGAREKTAA